MQWNMVQQAQKASPAHGGICSFLSRGTFSLFGYSQQTSFSNEITQVAELLSLHLETTQSPNPSFPKLFFYIYIAVGYLKFNIIQ